MAGQENGQNDRRGKEDRTHTVPPSNVFHAGSWATIAWWQSKPRAAPVIGIMGAFSYAISLRRLPNAAKAGIFSIRTACATFPRASWVIGLGQ
jgi:hypothetical protein